MTAKRKPGRPPEAVPQEIADAVCEWIAEGRPLREFCRQPGMPCRATVDNWRLKDEAFASRVARARDIGYDQIAEECVQIADTPLAGVTTVEDEEGTKTTTEDMLGHRKLQVETRLKLLACWDPRRYGQKAQVDHAGGVTIQVTTGVPRDGA